ncbi:ABC transporter ATPase [Mucilaginibacter ginkgonis]|uniref:ABC transporter ATPase n=1 Tax=Mucilaginibacter ginkgonis TaxID=2682091 RepID=A0A6I4HYV7_9SPHI|nr:ABC transporter ATPase [Mucilaginibacter ginkgonis]QQL49647.1 ABC transporter ATPase [Mucilaginibacter ginkgonis]
MEFSQQSRVWVYQANREFTVTETNEIQQYLNQFTAGWAAHGNQLAAGAEIRYNRFILLFVDETQAGASGCSIDKSVNFIKQLGERYQIDFFDRFNLAYRDVDKIKSASRDEFEQMVKDGTITPDTIVFNNTIQNVDELRTKWEVPFKESWHARLFGNLIPA